MFLSLVFLEVFDSHYYYFFLKCMAELTMKQLYPKLSLLDF